MSLRESEADEAIHTFCHTERSEVSLIMDCHETPCVSRNDKNSPANITNTALDSSALADSNLPTPNILGGRVKIRKGGGDSIESLDSAPSHSDSAHSAPSDFPALPIIFHLLADSLSPRTLVRLRALETSLSALYPCEILIHSVAQADFMSLTPWGEAGANWCTYFRLKLGEVLDSAIARAVYLDTDTLILGDVRELFALGLNGASVAMARNLCATDIVIDGLVSAEEYCNSGVLLIDMAKWRAADMSKVRGFAYLSSADQDFINFTFRGNIKILPFRWNLQWLDTRRILFDNAPYNSVESLINAPKTRNGWEILPSAYTAAEYNAAVKNPKIVHLLGCYKPWEVTPIFANNTPIFRHNPYHSAWWHIARETPFSAQISLAYAKRFIKTRLSYFLKYRTPRLYNALHAIKKAIKPKHEVAQNAEAAQ